MARRVSVGLGLVVALTLLLLVPGGSVTAEAPRGEASSNAHAASLRPLAAAIPNPFYTGMPASVALGAPNLTGSWTHTPPNASSFIPDPELSCVDPSGDIWSPDFPAGRVLEFKPPFSSGEAATVFLGQTSASGYLPNTTRSGLSEVGACTFDAQGNLWVSDFGNNRVLEYVPPFTTGMNAALVIGQSSFTGAAFGTTARNLTEPVGLAFDAQGDLWVADAGNNRVLEFTPPFSNGMAASLVLGQTGFTSRTNNLTSSNLSYPIDVAYSSGVLWVADDANSRVVGFSAPFSTGEGATYLLGQASFTGSGATGAAGLSGPASVSVDSRGDLWVSDLGDNRVVEYLPPFSVFENASVAIGQKTLTSTTENHTATTLWEPIGAFVAPSGNLWVTDSANSRVLEYVPAVFHVTFHITGLASGTNWSVIVQGSKLLGNVANLTIPEENGSYPWSVPTLSGYSVTPRTGNALVNGGSITISLSATRVTYTVTFTALGLVAPTNWSVTLGGVARSSVSNGTITFTEANGSLPFLVRNVSGYTITPTRGSVLVNGTNLTVAIGFAPVPTSSSSSSSLLSTWLWIVLIVVALLIGLLVGLLLRRRRKAEPSGPTPWSAPAGGSSPPPPGGGSSPPPPPGSGSPPPGAVG